jgi:hypothetical protein
MLGLKWEEPDENREIFFRILGPNAICTSNKCRKLYSVKVELSVVDTAEDEAAYTQGSTCVGPRRPDLRCIFVCVYAQISFCPLIAS